ncbi:hypothetical protein ACO0QE_001229 [Hanseniaspora vineae]
MIVPPHRLHSESPIHTSVTEYHTAIDHASDNNIVNADTLIEDEYFKTNPKPEYLDKLVGKAEKFLKSIPKTCKIVLLTSGGTTVPLENNTVRFIDNFSAGTRGASSAEQFLANGYYVIFLHREFSLTPFNRQFTHSTTTQFLDYFNEHGELKEDFKAQILEEKKLQLKYKKQLLLLPFTTVNQYLWSLRSIALLMNNKNCLFYLAAAVSDFYVPYSKLPQHKIQSSNEHRSGTESEGGGSSSSSSIFLRRLVQSWAKSSMIISFKLETDSSILIKKAQQALKNYNHQLVIGNLLQTRNKEVVFVSEDANIKEQWINLTPDVSCIEALIIPEAIKRHQEWIATQESK